MFLNRLQQRPHLKLLDQQNSAPRSHPTHHHDVHGEHVKQRKHAQHNVLFFQVHVRVLSLYQLRHAGYQTLVRQNHPLRQPRRPRRKRQRHRVLH